MKNKKAKREKVAKVARVPIMLEQLLENIVKLARRAFKGFCYNCDKAGHKAANCIQANAVIEKSENDDESEVPVGGVWMIGNVDSTTAACENGCACEGLWKPARRASQCKCYDLESGEIF